MKTFTTISMIVCLGILTTYTASSQILDKSVPWQMPVKDNSTIALYSFDSKTDWNRDDAGLSKILEPRSVEWIGNGCFMGAIRLKSQILNVKLPVITNSGAVKTRTIDFQIRLSSFPVKTSSILRIEDVSLLVTPEGTLLLQIGDTGKEQIRGKSLKLKPETWQNLSLMIMYRYPDYGEVRVTLDGVPIVEQALPDKVGKLFRKSVESAQIQIGDKASSGLTLDLDALRVSSIDRQFYESDPDALKLKMVPVRPVESVSLNSQSGAISFWMQPVNWDIRLISGQQKWNPAWGEVTVPLFSVGTGEKAFREIWKAVFHRNVKDSVLMEINPASWHLITLNWYQGKLEMFLDKNRVSGKLPISQKPVPKDGWTANSIRFLDAQAASNISSPASGTNKEKAVQLQTRFANFKSFPRFLSPGEIETLAEGKNPADVPLDVEVMFNPAKEGIDFRAYLFDPSIKRIDILIQVPEPGHAPVTASFVPDKEIQAYSVPVHPLGFGTYTITVTPFHGNGKQGKPVSITKEWTRPPWFGFKGGISDKVMPGWTPVTVEGNSISITRRKISLANSGLPSSVFSNGDEILTAPVEMKITDKQKEISIKLKAASPPKMIKSTETEAVFESQVPTDAGFSIKTSTRIEFDGLMWFEVTLLPEKGSVPVLDSLQVIIPYKPENAELLHWWSGEFKFGRGTMRSPKVVYCGSLPEKKGEVFRSNDEKILHTEGQKGNFIPYLMLTGMDRGMSWFGRNDRGWTPSQKPAIRIDRNSDRVNLILNIINEPVRLESPRTFTFGLQPIPLKNLPTNWRMNCGQCVLPDYHVGNCLKSKNGPKEHFNLLPDNLDWDAVMRRYQFGEDGVGSMLKIHDREAEQFQKLYARAPELFEVRTPGIYFNMQWVGNFPDIAKNWSDTQGFGIRSWVDAENKFEYFHYSGWFQDFAAWSWDQWLKKTPIAAFYLDDTWCAPQKQEGGPAAYRLPDGHIQPGYQFLEYRERFKRMRQLFYENGKIPLMCVHMTHTYFTPYCGMFDIALEGEDRYPNPDKPFEDKKDFIDKWPLDRLRFHNAEKWGLISAWLGWGERWGWRKQKEWYRHQENAFTAAMALNDIEWRFNPEFMAASGYRKPDTKFISYWQKQLPYRNQNADIKLAIWQQKGKCLVLVVNTGDKDQQADIVFELGKLGLNSSVKIRDVASELAEKDAKTGERSPFNFGNGHLTCPVVKHEYRLFELFQ